MSDSTPVKTHQPCWCGQSSDAAAIYSDGHEHCFSCGATRFDSEDSDTPTQSAPKAPGDFLRGTYTALTRRRLTEETCRFWSYMTATDSFGKHVQVAQYLNSNRQVVAQKLRYPDKTFPWKNRQGFKGLYGQWLWKTGGKKVVITEGELDALSVSQAQDNKWPVVSLPDGTTSAPKAIKEALEWLEGFEQVILFFDNDEPGRKAVDEVKRLLSPGKAHVTWAPEGYKDASDLLQAGKASEIVKCVWNAKQYRPDGIVSGADILKRLKERPKVTSFSYPDFMDKLNWMSGGGFRLGELDTWTSGTGMGKTTIIKALQHHVFHTTEFNQTLIHLEEPLEDTAIDLISYELGQRVSLGEVEVSQGTIDAAADRLFTATDEHGNPRLQLYDAFGSLEDDSLYGIIRYMTVAGGCKVFWLDHLSILVSDMDQDGDERRRIDSIMHNLKSLTVELGVYIGLISHLNKPQGSGKSFETGAVPTLDNLRGSGAIKQFSNGVYAISRDQQAANPIARNTSTITVLKCRKTGRTGTADYVLFNDQTGRLEKGVDPASLSDNAFDNVDNDGEY